MFFKYLSHKIKSKTMIKDGLSGANTRTGLVFEDKTDLATFLNSQQSYKKPPVKKIKKMLI